MQTTRTAWSLAPRSLAGASGFSLARSSCRRRSKPSRAATVRRCAARCGPASAPSGARAPHGFRSGVTALGMSASTKMAVLALALATPSLAQTYWRVLSRTGIQDAITAASPGDVILLVNNPGSSLSPEYTGFTLDKGLTIRGDGASIGMSAQMPGTLGITVAVPPGQVAHLENLDCTYSYTPYGSVGTAISVQTGTVRIEQCTLLCSGGVPALSIANADVAVVRSTITGTSQFFTSAEGVSATNSIVTFADCVITGANSLCTPYSGCAVGTPAKPAVVATGSSLHAERTTFVGGNHAAAFAGNGANAIEATNCSLWLAQCSLTGGSSTNGTGGTALANIGSVLAQLQGTTLLAGMPGGSAGSGPIDPSAELVRLELVPPFQRGATSTLTVRGMGNAPWGIWLALDSAGSFVTVVEEPVWVVLGAPIDGGWLDAAGTANFAVAVPSVPALAHRTVWFQALSGSHLPLHATTIAGGVIR